MCCIIQQSDPYLKVLQGVQRANKRVFYFATVGRALQLNRIVFHNIIEMVLRLLVEIDINVSSVRSVVTCKAIL